MSWRNSSNAQFMKLLEVKIMDEKKEKQVLKIAELEEECADLLNAQLKEKGETWEMSYPDLRNLQMYYSKIYQEEVKDMSYDIAKIEVRKISGFYSKDANEQLKLEFSRADEIINQVKGLNSAQRILKKYYDDWVDEYNNKIRRNWESKKRKYSYNKIDNIVLDNAEKRWLERRRWLESRSSMKL
jgi:hypothetical protein